MWFSLLGPLEVLDESESLTLGGPRQRSVLALLLVEAGRVVDVDRLVSEIWGEPPPDRARYSLYTYVSNLRGIIGRERILRAGNGYQFHPQEADAIDVCELESALVASRRVLRADPEAAVGLIDQALSLWRGRPYHGLEELPSIAPEVARIEELRLSAIEDRIEAELRAGITPDVGSVEIQIKDHPYRERSWVLLARSLYRAGRQTEALRTLTALRLMLADDIGIDPSPEVVRLEEQILLHDPSLDPGATPPSNLPAPVTSFVGRNDELDALERLIDEHRLVTVTGPGGVGKTRLALEVASRVAGSFRDGVWFVDLTEAADPQDVAAVVTSTLQLMGSPPVGPIAALLRHLRAQSALLLLDNCDRVADSVGDLVAEILSSAPLVRVVATSRQVLRAPGEHRFRLDGLATASAEGELGDAERLFAERAADVRPGYRLHDDTRATVVSICRHLDGLPLAIELAAARADTLSEAEIAHHLPNRLEIFGDGRETHSAHRSLRASLDWSYGLLNGADRDAFDRLGVFEGQFLGDAAAAVLNDGSEIGTVDLLRNLVGTSLVQVLPTAPSSYRLLETMRLYARAHLHDADRWDVVEVRHDSHYRDECRRLRGASFDRRRVAARVAIEVELTEYERAFERFVDNGRFEDALEMAWPLGHVWLYSGNVTQGVDRLARLLDASHGVSVRARADTLTIASFLAMYVTEWEQALAWTDEALEIYRRVGDEQGLAYALARSGHLAFSVGEAPMAFAKLRESLELCNRIGYEDGIAWPLTLLAQARLWSGDHSDEVGEMLEQGRRHFIAMGDTYGLVHANMFLSNLSSRTDEERRRYCEESVELLDRPGADPLIRSVAFHNLAFSVWFAGEFERAAGLNRMAARSSAEMGVTVHSGMAFLQAALFAGSTGNAQRAAVLYGAGDRHMSMEMPPFWDSLLRPGIDAATSALGEAAYCRLHELGQAMSVEEATEFLLGGSPLAVSPALQLPRDRKDLGFG